MPTPYRRFLRPSDPKALPQYVDGELQRLQTAIEGLTDAIASGGGGGVGPTGPAGADGIDGATGPAGADGAVGPAGASSWSVPSSSYFDQGITAVARSSASYSANRVVYTPFIATGDVTLQSLGVYANNAVAGSQVIVGIYSNSAGRPGTKLADTGAMSSAAIGSVHGAVSVSLVSGETYWLAVLGSATQQFRSLPTTAARPVDVTADGVPNPSCVNLSTTFSSGLPPVAVFANPNTGLAISVIMRAA